MRADKRNTGIPLVGELPWGTHFCQFYQTTDDQLEILLPYFDSGLKANEVCIWVTPEPQHAEDLLRESAPSLGEYLANGQMRILASSHWQTVDAKLGGPFVAMLDDAMCNDFEGLRLAFNIEPNSENRSLAAPDTESIRSLNVLALFAYPRDQFNASQAMAVTKSHRFALIRNARDWDIIESSEARVVKDDLKRSEEKLESLFSNMSEGFAYHRIVLNADGTPCDYVFLEINKAFEKLTGLRAEALIGKRATTAIPGIENDPTNWIGLYGKVALTQEPTQFESYSAYLKRWYSISAFSPHKGFFGVTFSDITQRKLAEEALACAALETERQRQLLAVTLSSIGDAVIVTDVQGCVTFLNGEAERLTGWTMAEAVGQPLSTIFHIVNEATREIVENPVDKVRRLGGVVGLANHTILIAKDGRETPIDDSGAPVRFEDGTVHGVVLVFRDITERKQAEEALYRSKESERQRAAELQAVLDTAPTAIWIAHDKECKRITGNAAADRLLSAPRRSNISASAPQEEAAVVYRVYRQGVKLRPEQMPAQVATATGKPVLGEELELVLSNGNKIDLIESAVPLLDAEGNVRGAIITGEDITQRKAAERVMLRVNETLEQTVAERTTEVMNQADQLRALASELSQAEQRERRRLAKVLHDHIQQLLVAARLQLDWMKRGDRPERIQSTVQGVDAILKEAIEASRSLTIDLSPPVLHEAGLVGGLSWLATRMQEKNQLTVHLRADSNAEPASEETRLLLFECVRELLFNAVKHAGVTEIEVTLLRTQDEQIKLIVRDAGNGFDPDLLLKRKTGEATYGLFSIQQRLAHIGGEMDIETAPGKGTRISLSVPTARTQIEKELEESQADVEHAVRISVRGKSTVCRVLIVDDHKIMREGLRGLLQFETGIEIVGEAADGQQAIELAERLAPDVVIMDVNLGRMSGIDATRKILAANPRIKVVGLSMHVDNDVALSMRNAGAVAYLSKGGPSEDLVAAIKACATTAAETPIPD